MSSSIYPRVLIAEDYGPMATALTRLLTPECEVVGVAPDGRGAVEMAERLKPDLVLVDLNLPDISGLEVCRAVTRSNPQTKVIVVTGLVDPTFEDLARAAGAAAFLSKTAAGTELLAAINRALSEPPASSYPTS